ncbi:MAG: HEPN domain-containing protein [Candidatus Latescibacteria bacterium]|nr:HEPN domain-containing protein [Candidatus Latescibacterota bacterium]MBT4139079.1 HEPN domain-containing protein [Candidatus Latescibacterota bacterium]
MSTKDIQVLVQGRMQQAKESLDDGFFLREANRSNRTIVNRTYYAAFYAALALLQTINFTPRKHSGVLSFFDKEFVRTGLFGKEHSKSFHRLFQLRQKDDYDLIDTVPDEEADEALQLSQSFNRCN